jgi:NADPH:quinone reductase-like Zn-dependent oxidoreductase
MKVFQVQNGWSLENLQLAARPQPNAGPGAIRLRMLAAALNYRDLLVPKQGYGVRMQPLPLIMLSDGVGVIDQVGAGVDSVQLGDRVCPIPFCNWLDGDPDETRLKLSLGVETDGTMAEYMVLPATGVAAVPAYLGDPEAASLPTAGITAWRTLVTVGRVKPGDTVLIQGTGGVALFALQFAKMLGARVICTSSSDEKLARVRALGADETINYSTIPQWGKAARAMTSGRGVDHIVEVGGEATLPQSLRAVRPGGTISMIGVLGGSNLNASLGLIVTRHVCLQGITVGSREDFRAMVKAMSQHAMHPVVDRVFAFEQLHQALQYLASGKHFGKVCISHGAIE